VWYAYQDRTGLAEKFPLYKLPTPDVRLSLTTADFLTKVGLPDAAGLRFDGLPKGLRRASEVYGSTYPWSERELERLRSCLILGDDAGGNPICLDTANRERIVFLNHERGFALAEVVNSGVA